MAPDGHGYIKPEIPNRVDTAHVPGDSHKTRTVFGSGRNGAKIEVSMTRGGITQVTTKARNPIVPSEGSSSKDPVRH